MEDQRASGRERAQAAPGRQRRRWEEFSGIAILVLSLGVGLLMLAVGQAPYIPRWLWAVLLIGCLFATFLATSGLLTGPWHRLAYTGAVLSSWTLLLTMPNQGMIVVLLVVVAAAGSYILPMPVVLGVIVMNCAVVLVHLVTHAVAPMEYLAVTAFYAIIHLASMFSTYALHRESGLRAELEQKNVELEAASVLLESSAKTAERLRISRELHDAVGHQLTVLNLELEAAGYKAHRMTGGGAEDVCAHIDRAAGVAKELLADVRATVGELRATGPGHLREHLERLAAAVPSLDIFVEVPPRVDADEQQMQTLVRAAQEVITNTVKHAEAHELSIRLEQDAGELRMVCVNDGLAPGRIVEGHGFTGLRERLEPLGGTLTVRPSPFFTVEVALPVTESTGAPHEPSGRTRRPAAGKGTADE